MEPTENVIDWRQLNQFTQFLPIAMKMLKKQMDTRLKKIKKKSPEILFKRRSYFNWLKKKKKKSKKIL